MPRLRAVGWPLLALALGALPSRAAAQAIDPIPVLTGNRILLPGPRALGFDGLAADPSTIGHFQGLAALVYVKGRVRDAEGRRWRMLNDIRLFQGDYIAADGLQRRGTFAFV